MPPNVPTLGPTLARWVQNEVNIVKMEFIIGSKWPRWVPKGVPNVQDGLKMAKRELGERP